MLYPKLPCHAHRSQTDTRSSTSGLCQEYTIDTEQVHYTVIVQLRNGLRSRPESPKLQEINRNFKSSAYARPGETTTSAALSTDRSTLAVSTTPSAISTLTADMIAGLRLKEYGSKLSLTCTNKRGGRGAKCHHSEWPRHTQKGGTCSLVLFGTGRYSHLR